VWQAEREGFRTGSELSCRVTDRGPDHVVLRLAGELSWDAASLALERSLEEHYVKDGVSRIRLDLRDLEGIDLEGVAVLVELFREAQLRGKTLTVERARGAVRDKLLTTGVLRIMGLRSLG
jgi:anti-anti-sigma factor